MSKDTFCPMPFVTLTVNPGNYISRCMMSMTPMGPIEKSTYSNEKFKTLRNNMLNGVWDEIGCESCFFKEKHGLNSQRTKWLAREEKYLRETGLYEKNKNIDRNRIYHLYMNFNNICNFKCRMCGPGFSNAWIPDYMQLEKEFQKSVVPAKQQVDVDKFLYEYGPELSDIRQIWITGGEPFMDNSIFDFFKKLKNYCSLDNIIVTINTNGSKIDIEKIQNLNQLKKLHINVSVDSTDDYYTYMRGYNFTFSDLNYNLKQLMEINRNNNKFLLTINGAFQLYNILNVERFYEWCNEITENKNADWIEYRVLTGPKYLQARHAPESIKQQCREQVNRLIVKYPNNFYLSDLLTELNHSSDPYMINKFLMFNNQLDKIRNTNLNELFPELVSEWIREGKINENINKWQQ